MNSFVIGMIAGALCTISFVPQVVKIFKTKNAKDLSLLTFSVFSFGVLLWVVYGVLVKELPIILTNAVIFVLAIAIVVMKVRYDD
ncbi:MAG: SemiSWEET transporter [Endomicrobiales bacterium]|nr:SemiSWEET transporter [Endomicrobiales bacterium]